MIKVVTIVGARPQFIKAAAVSRHLRAGATEVLVHTGQHYDDRMSAVFFDELNIPSPDYNLGVGSGLHGAQTGEMLARIEALLLKEKPDRVLVYGDTNSTLAGALAAVKLHIPVAHVESGLRSYNRAMPEEHNRVLTDHCSELLFCPTGTAVANLAREGVLHGVHNVGDTMLDMVLAFSARAAVETRILNDLKLSGKQYYLATLHRPYNVDNVEVLCAILEVLFALKEPVVFPVHPRTRKNLREMIPDIEDKVGKSLVKLIDPVGYLDMLSLERAAKMILTDSGGVQKEAYFLGVPCVTLRPETEWVETVEAGWNRVVGSDSDRIFAAITATDWPGGKPPPLFGDGRAGEKIATIVLEHGSAT